RPRMQRSQRPINAPILRTEYMQRGNSNTFRFVLTLRVDFVRGPLSAPTRIYKKYQRHAIPKHVHSMRCYAVLKRAPKQPYPTRACKSHPFSIVKTLPRPFWAFTRQMLQMYPSDMRMHKTKHVVHRSSRR